MVGQREVRQTEGITSVEDGFGFCVLNLTVHLPKIVEEENIVYL